MTDLRRNVLWGVFLVSLFLLWDAWNRHTGQPSMFAPAPRPTASAPAAAGAGPAGVPTASGAAVAQAAPPAAAAAPAGEKVEIRTDTVAATFDSVGGELIRLALLKYPDADHPDQPTVLMERNARHVYTAQSGLASAQAGQQLPSHLTPMKVVPGARALQDGQDKLSLRFESEPVGGVVLAKTYTFTRGGYAIGVRHEVVNQGSAPIRPELYLQLQRDASDAAKPGFFAAPTSFTGPALWAGEKFEKIDFSALDKGKVDHTVKSDQGWISMVQHYFLSAWLDNAKGAREFRANKVGPNLYAISMLLPLGDIAPGATKAHDAILLAGPQEEKKLEALAPGQHLDLVKDYGFLTILAKPLFSILSWLHGLLGNWGWAIVGLVVLLKAAFYWLNASAYRSMAKMKLVAPKMQALKAQHGSDPQRMQQEMMKLYREEKVNPIGGCLPIFIQMPFFFALYWVLLSSVEMRGAPWIGWIHDLSKLDPLYILPALMTASTLLQTWLAPQSEDPMQRKMMWIMPLVFSVMFFVFPAGLVLYWLTNNLLGILQQWWINRSMGLK